MNDTLSELRQMLYPDGIKCIICGREISKNRYGLCPECSFTLNVNYCVRCGRHKVGIGDYCGECGDMSLYFDEARSSVNYDGLAKDAVRRLKYGGAAYLSRHLSEFMLDTLFSTDWEFDCFTYVPMFAKKQKKRGYNQAQLLAQDIAARTTTPCLPLLEKTISTSNQASLNKQERMKNLSGTFRAVSTVPDVIVLIDDVMTTGATVNECAKTLKRAGAKIVYVLTFASVPEKPSLDKNVKTIKEFGRNS